MARAYIYIDARARVSARGRLLRPVHSLRRRSRGARQPNYGARIGDGAIDSLQFRVRRRNYDFAGVFDVVAAGISLI